MSAMQRGGPLKGIRVVELTKVWAGPYTGKLLSFLGAEVIRVESENSLDVTRVYGVSDINNAPGFKAVNTQKLSVQIDMKTEKGRQLILDLLKETDVLVENLRPGATSRLGLSYEQVKTIKPDIIYVSMGMYGSEGPLSYQTGYAPCFAAIGGLSALVGYEGEVPKGMNIRYADSTFGAGAAYATTVALLHRKKTQEGQFIDVSAVESMSSMLGDAMMDFSLNGKVAYCDGNRHADMAPHGVYPCREGEWICIAVSSEESWHALSTVMGESAFSAADNFSTLENRKNNEAALDKKISQWTEDKNADELSELLQQRGVAATKSNNSLELISDPNLWARGFYQEVSDYAGSKRMVLGPAWTMSRAAKIVDDAPILGQHNEYILGEILGLSSKNRKALSEAGITK